MSKPEPTAVERLIALSQVRVNAHQRTENGQTFDVAAYYRNGPIRVDRLTPQQLYGEIGMLQRAGADPKTTPDQHTWNRGRYNELTAESLRRSTPRAAPDRRTAMAELKRKAANSRPEPTAERWEYKPFSDHPSAKAMNALAADGWVLDNVRPGIESQGWIFKDRKDGAYIFKRKMTPEAIAAADELERLQGQTKWGKFKHAISEEGLAEQDAKLAEMKAARKAGRRHW